jgi:hypothetical protein
MAKVKKYANGGSYTVEVKGSPKPAAPKEKPAPKFNAGGWNIPQFNPDAK